MKMNGTCNVSNCTMELVSIKINHTSTPFELSELLDFRIK